MPRAVASDVREGTPANSELAGKPGGIMTFRGQQYEARILPGTILNMPKFLKGEPASTDRCFTLTGMSRGTVSGASAVGLRAELLR